MYQADLTRIKECMKRAKQGGELTIGFLGGSITQGSLASTEQDAYAYRVFHWWEETFRTARFSYVNGGIGGTTSHYGVSRAVTDVLMYQPEFVVVDFSVNDEADIFSQETFEGVVRKILSWPSHPALVLLNNVYYDTGANAQAYHNAIGEWYHVPYVSIKDTVYKQMVNGEYTRDELTSDGLHPNDKGHALVAGEIIAFLEAIQASLDTETTAADERGQTIAKTAMSAVEAERAKIEKAEGTKIEKAEGAKIEKAKTEDTKAQAEPFTDAAWEDVLPEPMTKNAYENAKRLTIREISPRLDGFRADAREKMGHLDHFKNGWIGTKPGDGIIFEVEASCIAVQYRKAIRRPALRAELILDGDTAHKVILDGNFEQDWGDCLFLEPILHHGELARHTVEIRICEEEQIDREVTPFYLMALIIA